MSLTARLKSKPRHQRMRMEQAVLDLYLVQTGLAPRIAINIFLLCCGVPKIVITCQSIKGLDMDAGIFKDFILHKLISFFPHHIAQFYSF